VKHLKRIGKILACVLGAALLLAILHASLVLFFPGVLFRHEITYRNFTVQSTEPISPEIHTVLDRAHDLLSASEINDPTLHHDVYLCKSYRLMRFLLYRNVHFGAMLPTGDTIVTDSDVANDIARAKRISAEDRRVRTLSGTIVHEIVHHLIRRHVGYREERRIPTWIKEGYGDFIARDSAIDVASGISTMTAGSPPPSPGFFNFCARVMIDHLMNEQGMTFEEILDERPEFWEVAAEVQEALTEDGARALERLRGTETVPVER
jgi:hypothetical protein